MRRAGGIVAVVAAVATAAALPACRKTDGGGPRGSPGAPATAALRVTPLSLLPAETQMVMSLDLARLRKTPLLAKLAAANPLPAPLLQLVDAFAAKSGIDPWRTVDSVVVAGASKTAWAIVVRAQKLDEARLAAGARQALQDAADLVSEKRGRWTFWTTRGRPGTEAFLLDERTLVVAVGGWAAKIAAVAPGGAGAASAPSAATNADLAKLCQGVSDRPVWGAAVVSAKLRDEWLDDLQTQEAASLDRITLSLDVGTALEGKLTLGMTEAAAADRMAEELAGMLVRERRENQASPMFTGLLKGITTYTDGNAAAQVDVSLSEDQLLPLARFLSRYWRMVGTKLPEPSRRAQPLRMVPVAGFTKAAAIALGDARVLSDWNGDRYAIVEVTNRGSRPVAPALQLVYRRQSGDMITPGACVVQVGILKPREKAVCVGPAPASAVSANYDVYLGDDSRTKEARIPLEVSDAQLGPPFGPNQWVAGRVKNASGAVLERPQIHITFYDAVGKIVGYSRDDLDGKPLPPGTEAAFQASSMVVMPSAATRFTVTAFGIGQKPELDGPQAPRP